MAIVNTDATQFLFLNRTYIRFLYLLW